MNFDIFYNLMSCNANLGTLGVTLLYLHIPVSVAALLVSLYVWKQSLRKEASKIIIYISLIFALWVILNNLAWIGAMNIDTILFAWSLIDPVTILLFVFVYYFVFTYVHDRDLPKLSKYFIILITAPYIVLSFTSYNISAYDLSACLPVQNLSYLYYGFSLKVFFTLLSFYYLLLAVKSTTLRKRETITLAFGVISFILTFFVFGYLAENTGKYVYEFYSLFGVVAFLVSISVLVVRFKVFNIKGLGVQLIVFLQIFFIASQLLLFRSKENLSIILATLFISVVFGIILIINTNKGQRQRAQLEIQSEALIKLNQNLKDKDKVRSEFMLLASHQLRSPLTALRGYASMIKEKSFGQYPDKLAEPIDRIYESATHLNNVVTDLLSISKIELGGLTYAMQIFDIKRMLKDIVEEMDNMIKMKKLSVSQSDDGSALYLVRGDVEKLRQVFINIVDNAIKYTEEGHIGIFIKSLGHEVVVEVSDTGSGFDDDKKGILFRKFMRGDGEGINRSGSGVGLYLAKKIVDAHGGKIEARSDGKGKGSTFSVYIPIKD